MKKLYVGIAILVVLVVGWYLVSPLFIVVERDDTSPIVKDSLDDMSIEEREEFDNAVEDTEEGDEMSDKMPVGENRIVSVGEFHPRAHSVEGKVLLIESDGKKVLRFEDFETDNGPNLHIYLSSDLGASDFVDLGRIKATKGNVNYEIDQDIDFDKYDKVLVWCVPFKVLFSYAELN